MKNNLTKIFCIYTLIIPFLYFFLMSFNTKYGVACGDGCSVHSYFIHYTILLAFVFFGILNIILFSLAKANLVNMKACLWMVIFNSIQCVALFFTSINLWFLLIVAWPAQIASLASPILWWYILLKEVFKKEKNVLLLSIIAGIVAQVALSFLSKL